MSSNNRACSRVGVSTEDARVEHEASCGEVFYQSWHGPRGVEGSLDRAPRRCTVVGEGEDVAEGDALGRGAELDESHHAHPSVAHAGDLEAEVNAIRKRNDQVDAARELGLADLDPTELERLLELARS